MKTAAKVFIIIGMIFEFWLIIPLIVGAIALNKLNTVMVKKELTVIGICVILFCSILGGIFMLCISEEEIKEDWDKKVGNNHRDNTMSTKEAMENLQNLKKLFEEGVINEKDYEEKRKRYLNQL